MKLRWIRAARKHRIGRESAAYVMATAVGRPTPSRGADPAVKWVGIDERGRVLTVIAFLVDETITVIHVQPEYRPGRSEQ